MTETYTGPTNVEDIEDDTDTSTALERQADAILANDENRSFGAPPLRQAVREDAATARDWSRNRVAGLRGAVEAEPVKASLYALGIGVVIGLLAAR
ncbi:MAG: hypothetical protein PSV23_07755 [Brevundimonas sp.]|uniref:hypothetical protein n=1 Tax=Brevundimonas sp. TaxID=1871086 RepID=UPI0024883831|nr:hypothetical protein [Brevundimonas sp.]MDI1326681.1 hypothetical protein [Brevundimonas sp.]